MTDATAVALWDRHLSQGKVVRGMGNTDAHLYQAIGDVWNGVLIGRPTRQRVLRELWAGHFFASDGPFVHLGCEDAVMGDTVHRPKAGRVEFRYQCADSLGLRQVRLVAGGQGVEDLRPRDARVVKGTYALNYRGGAAYLRLECFACDNRRAYSNPIYLRPRSGR